MTIIRSSASRRCQFPHCVRRTPALRPLGCARGSQHDETGLASPWWFAVVESMRPVTGRFERRRWNRNEVSGDANHDGPPFVRRPESQRNNESLRRTSVAYSDGERPARGFVTCAKGRFARRRGSWFLSCIQWKASKKSLSFPRQQPHRGPLAMQVSVPSMCHGRGRESILLAFTQVGAYRPPLKRRRLTYVPTLGTGATGASPLFLRWGCHDCHERSSIGRARFKNRLSLRPSRGPRQKLRLKRAAKGSHSHGIDSSGCHLETPP